MLTQLYSRLLKLQAENSPSITNRLKRPMSSFSSPNESSVSVTMTKFRDSNHVPLDPGVYLMKDNEGNIIYIGKAKNLRKRVLSYFSHGSNTRNEGVEWKTKKLVARVSDVEFVTTENEIEAYLLESNLIKRYRPLFNIELKDQQRYT